MSEPASFFLHAHITESNLKKFFHSPATNIKDYDDWLPWFTEEQRLYGDPAKMLNKLATCNSGESEKNIYAEHINFNKETQIVTMDHIFLSESYEIFMPLMACVRGIEKFITPGENNFALIYYYWWGSEIAIALEFDANGSRITANPKAENLTIADAFFDEHGEALAEELYNKQGLI
ncbi:cytoplasmic protein [Salmonella enterica]|nr:cytoplasmic protein [Salmonella enterica]